jgi:hypothetical protein
LKITEISVTGRELSAGTPCHIKGKRKTTTWESFKEKAVIGRAQAANVRRNWNDRRYCRGWSFSKAQWMNRRLLVQIMVTFWIVAQPWPAMSRKRIFAPGEEKIIMILPGFEAPISQLSRL